MSKHSSRWKQLVAVAFATSLIAAACGDDGGGDTTQAPAATGTSGGDGEMKATVEGCENGYSDPADISVGREVSRCEPGFPAPVPLAEKTKIIIGTNFKLEFNSPVAVADSLGEYAKENLEIEFVALSFSDAIPQLSNGTVDVSIGGFETALFNSGEQDLGIKVIAGNYFPPDAGNYDVPQTGLWCKREFFTDPADPDFSELETSKWGTSAGRGSSAVYYSAAELETRLGSFAIEKVDVQRTPSTDILAALDNGAIDCGILLDPLWTAVKDNPDYVQAATQTPGEPLGHMVFGKSLLVDNPEVGQAFLRAYIRTVNTYFDGNYHQDDMVMKEIQKWTGATDESQATLKTLPPLVFDWEVRADTTTRIQELFIKLGVIENFDTPVPEDKLVDRSVAAAVLGIK